MNVRLPVIVLFMSSIGWGLTWLPIKALNDLGLDSMHLIFIAFLSGQNNRKEFEEGNLSANQIYESSLDFLKRNQIMN